MVLVREYNTDQYCPFLFAIDVIVVSLKSGSDKLGHYLKKVYEGPLRISIEIVDDNTGTADALASIKDKIKVDRHKPPSSRETSSAWRRKKHRREKDRTSLLTQFYS